MHIYSFNNVTVFYKIICMKNLIPIVNSLNNKEKRLIKKVFSNQPNGMEKKKLELFTLIVSGKAKNDKEASILLYKSPPNSAFSHVKRRLKKDLLNFILLQDSEARGVSKRIQVEVECRRMVLQGQLLFYRGIYGEGEKILNNALNLAEEYEMFADVLLIRNLLRSSIGFRKGPDMFEKYSGNMDYHYKELGKWLKARQYYYQIALPNEFQTNKMSESKDIGAKIIHDLEKIDDTGSSQRFTFWKLTSKVYYFNLDKNFKEAEVHADKLLALIPEGSIMRTRSNYAGILKDVVHIHINLGNYDRAVSHAEEAVNTFNKGMTNELRAMDYLFFAHLRNNDYKNAGITIEKALQHKQINAGNKLIKARWLFFYANLEYLNGNHKKAAQSLRTNDHITSDKSGWNLGCRLLEMMIDMEENDLFLVDYKLKNFNRLLSPKNTETENIERARLISKVIRLFIKHRGDFNETFEVAKNEIQALEDGEGQLFWDPMGYEVIRFDEWFRDKRDAKNNRRKTRKFSSSRPS